VMAKGGEVDIVPGHVLASTSNTHRREELQQRNTGLVSRSSKKNDGR